MPAFSVPNFEIDLPKNHTSITIHGNVVAKIAASFKDSSVDFILDEIAKTLKDTVQ